MVTMLLKPSLIVAVLTATLGLCSGEVVASLDQIRSLLREGKFEENIKGYVRGKEMSAGDEHLRSMGIHMLPAFKLTEERNQWTKSPLEQRNQWTKSPLEQRNQWTKSPLEQRNQWTKSPLEQRNQWTKSPLEQRNQWTKSPSVNYRADVNAGSCSTTFSTVTINAGDTAEFTSPNYPSKYPRNRNCGWIFSTAAGNEIKIECAFVDIRNNDYLTIRDGSEGTISQYTSTGSSIASFSTGESSIRVTFTSDRKRQGRGFRCSASVDSTTGATVAPVTVAPPSGTGGSCVCGVKQAGRIVGGSQATPNEYPWMVGMVDPYKGGWFNFCGGTLISSEWIVTAAHCLSVDYVMLGQYDYNTNTAPAEVRPVLQTIRHPRYRSNTNDNDIALLKIAPIDFEASPTIRPICLPDDPTENYTGQTSTVTGWGTTSSSGSVVDVLREVDVPIVSNSACASSYAGYTITSNMVCAGQPSGGIDSCQGDSGGPLIVADGANYEFVGVVSWGVGCGLAGFPGVYARVTETLDWISANTDASGYCPRS